MPMRFLPTVLPGVTIVEPEPVSDARGHFTRLSCPDEFARAGIAFVPTQTSLSFNRARHTLRGMHYCLEPEAKLVRCTRGRIFDIAVDLRRDSATFRRWFGLELDPVRAHALYVPSGVAHGFLSLEPDSDVLYQIDRRYRPGFDAGVRWNDPQFAIDWPAVPAVIDPRDRDFPDFV
jgi:dTDP-4-dehydrorhamnose 3,5-epimerase